MNGSMFIGTWWALVPPLLAILLAFVTKEVYQFPVHRIGSRCPFVHRLPSVGCVHKLL